MYSKERFDSLPNVIKKFFRFFYSNEVQLMQFDKIPYFPKELSFISHVVYPDETNKNKEPTEIFLINTSRYSFSGGYNLSETRSNLLSKYEYKDRDQSIIQYGNVYYRYAGLIEIIELLRGLEKNNLFQMERVGYRA